VSRSKAGLLRWPALSVSTGSPPPTPIPDAETPRRWIYQVAGALAHRNFRLLWFAALGSTIGTWMQQFAESWLVKSLTGPKSAFYLSLDVLLGQLPIILFILIGGVIADRHDRRRLLTGSQLVQAFSAFSLAALVFWSRVSVWQILTLSFISGCGQAFGGPAYQSMIPSLVPRRDLPNAIALNSSQFNLSRLLGPVTGAAVVVSFGMAACFALNGASFFFVVAALAVLKVPPRPLTTRQPLMDELRGGLRYVRGQRAVLTLTVLVFFSTFLAMPISTFLPIFASDVFTGGGTQGAQTRLAVLMAAQALGAIVGALIIGTLTRFKLGRVLFVVLLILGALIAAFATSRSWPLSCVLLFVGGIAFMMVFSISFSLVQLTVPDALRGRVVSIYMVALRGGWPLGSVVAGSLAVRFGAPHVMGVNGLLLFLLASGLLISGRGRSLRQI
jgi:MFS family permease